jgi:hypothetical protein
MITRRKFITLSATSAALASAAAAFSTTGFAQRPIDARLSALADALGEIPEYLISGSKKKGLGFGPKNSLWPSMLTDLKCKWCYTWMGNVPDDLPVGMEFIPMVRSRGMEVEPIANVARQAEAHGITELLGLNEPDATKQDNMTVEDALERWPLLMETGLRLGSPGCVHPDKEWMIEFMAGVDERKLRVDFVCVHSYGAPNPTAFINRLTKIHKLYDRPLWITEFGVGDWSAKSVEENKHSPEVVLQFMEKVLPMLDKLDFLERYAWFPSGTDSPPLGTSALFDADGALTPLGECYRDA